MNGESLIDPFARATAVEASYKLADGIYVLGCLENGVTVYSQQVRAHNLIWALRELAEDSSRPLKIAVVGGGIGGLTTAAAAMTSFEDSVVTVFEKRWDFCPLQSGSDNRWLHPRIYDWPAEGSRAPSASLPILNWSEGRAADVARQTMAQFNIFSQHRAQQLRIYVGLTHLRLTSSTKRLEWIGTKARLIGPSLEIGSSEGTSEEFDLVLLASGFGLERKHKSYGGLSYWRNDQRAQPVLDGTRQTYLVSGYGDGAVVDLCRLTLSRFRQDSILYDLFGAREIEDTERKVRQIKAKMASSPEARMIAFEEVMKLIPDHDQINSRRRRDTNVIAHVAGSTNSNTALSDIFKSKASFLNQFLFFLLYRIGAVSISFEPLENAVQEFDVPKANVICRHGTETMLHLTSHFTDSREICDRLTTIKNDQAQSANRYWVPGFFQTP